VIGGLFNAISKSSSSSSAGEKYAELTFSGEDPVPSVGPTGVVVVYVGQIRNDQASKYPQLRNYPEMEMAPTSRDAEGNRKISLSRVAANVPVGGFRDRRVAAELDRVSDTVIELSCTRPLAHGNYAIWVNEEAFELTVE